MRGEPDFADNRTSSCFPILVLSFILLVPVVFFASIITSLEGMLFFTSVDFLVFAIVLWILTLIFSLLITYIIQPYDSRGTQTLEEPISEVRRNFEKMREKNPGWRSDLVSDAYLCILCVIWIIIVPTLYVSIHIMDIFLGFFVSAFLIISGLVYGWRHYKMPLKKMDEIYEKLLQLEEFSDITAAGILSEVFSRPVDKNDVRPYILRLIDDGKIECIQTGLYRIIGQENQ
jgi:hypothetical protein